jgi:phage tail-like protein
MPARRGRSPTDPWSVADFRVVLDDVELAASQVLGLAQRADVSAASPAGDGLALAAVPVVTVVRALGPDRTLFDWAGGAGPRQRRVVVELWAPGGGGPRVAWILHGARPLRWVGPDLDATAGGVAFERLEIGFDTVEWRTTPER